LGNEKTKVFSQLEFKKALGGDLTAYFTGKK